MRVAVVGGPLAHPLPHERPAVTAEAVDCRPEISVERRLAGAERIGAVTDLPAQTTEGSTAA